MIHHPKVLFCVFLFCRVSSTASMCSILISTLLKFVIFCCWLSPAYSIVAMLEAGPRGAMFVIQNGRVACEIVGNFKKGCLGVKTPCADFVQDSAV